MENSNLVDKVKEWLQVDAEITALSNSLKEKKKEKKQMTDMLMETMKTNEIEVVNLNDGTIELKKNKVKSPLNKKNLLVCLTEYFGDSSESTRVNELVQHILNNRDEKVKEYIKRTTTTTK